MASGAPASSGYFDLRIWHFEVSTTIPKAQLWLNYGLNWTYAYNHAKAIACCERGLSWDLAQAVYREDRSYTGDLFCCVQHPDNIWSLTGLAECLQRRAPHADELAIARQYLALAQTCADVTITTSCFYRGQSQPAAVTM